VLDGAVLLDVMRLRRAANSQRYAPGKGGKSDASERVRDKTIMEVDFGARMCAWDLQWRRGVRGGRRAHLIR
jgi:hypothetical protein